MINSYITPLMTLNIAMRTLLLLLTTPSVNVHAPPSCTDTVVMGLSVIDIADSTYRGPADADIELRDDVNGFFAISISSYQVSLIVNAVLTAGVRFP